MNNKLYLVTGGSGFLGAALVKRLVREGARVRVIDNLSRGSLERLHEVEGKYEFIQGDIRDQEAVRKAVKGVGAVCHLAFVNGTEFFYQKPDLVLDVGVRGMVNLIDACMKEGVTEFFLASSSEVYQTPPSIPTDETVPLSVPDPLNPRYSYGASKIICEVIALNYGRRHFSRVIVFRPHNVYGPDMGWEHVIPQFAVRMGRLCRRQPEGVIPFPIQGTGKETRAFVYIDDFIDGLMRVIHKGEHQGIYHMGTREEVLIERVAQSVARCLGREIQVVPGTVLKGSPSRRCPDIAKIERLGYSPKFSFDKGVAVTVAWYLAHRDKAPQEEFVQVRGGIQ